MKYKIGPVWTRCVILIVLLIAFTGCVPFPAVSRQPVPAPTKPITVDTASALYTISYYAPATAWEQFWRQWPVTRSRMDQDLEHIHDLGANTVRLFVHPYVWGYPNPTPMALQQFEEALTLIDQHGLQAQITLFDCWSEWDDITGSTAWLNQVLANHRDDPRIALWELRNEVRMDEPAVQNWIRELLPVLNSLAGDTRTTVSVNRAAWLVDLHELTAASPPDLYSLHWYPDMRLWTQPFPGVLRFAVDTVGADRLRLGEFGVSTYAYSAATQERLYQDVLYYAHQAGIRHIGVWTLTDFPHGTAQCPGSQIGDNQWYFGLYRLDGSPRPAAATLRQAFGGQMPDTPAEFGLDNGTFEDFYHPPDRIANWEVWQQDDPTDDTLHGTLVQDCRMARSGHCAARFTAPPNSLSGMVSAPGLPVTHQNSYSARAYIRTSDTQGRTRLTLAWFDGSRNWLGNTESAYVEGGTENGWYELRIDAVRPPPETIYARLYVQRFTEQADTTLWIDDVQVWQADAQE